MHFLFGFSGRVGCAKIRLFLIVSLVWLFAIGLTWMIGLGIMLGQECVEDCAGRTLGPSREKGAFLAMMVSLFLLATYLVSCSAVYTKRLHDREKSAYWLVPFALIPFGVVVVKTAAPFALRFPIGPVGLGEGAVCVVGAMLALWGLLNCFSSPARSAQTASAPIRWISGPVASA
jgi:uncharacterized membrane protein YhaH (DUF805 family)